MTTIFLTLYFDAATEEAVQKFWHKLVEAGLDVNQLYRHRPHITLSAYDVEDVAESAKILSNFAPKVKAFPLRLHCLGIFPEKGVLFLAPLPTAALFDVQRALQTQYHEPVKYPEHLAPASWTPHCTLAVGLKPTNLAEAVKMCIEEWQPIIGTACGIGLRVSENSEDLFQLAFANA